jgi:uncharacterized OB-fold protein
MFGRMSLVVDKHTDVLIAPLNTISWEGEKQFVYKVAEGNIHRTQVKIGMRLQAVFKEKREASVLDIKYFKPLA